MNCLRHALLAAEAPLRFKGRLAEATRASRCGTERREPSLDGPVSELAKAVAMGSVWWLSVQCWGVERDAQGTTVWLELPDVADAGARPHPRANKAVGDGQGE